MLLQQNRTKIMENQIEIVKEIADAMIGIGGIPTNEEFYEEFNSRVTAKLGINFKYCQMKIEDKSKCKTQCEHCKEYYKPLERLKNGK